MNEANKSLNNYQFNKEINKKIKLINRYLKRNRTCYQIPGFEGLIEITNSDRPDELQLVGYLNHIWVILLLRGNSNITIESVNTKFGSTKPDIIFNYAKEKFLIEMKFFHKKGFDYKIHNELVNWQGEIFYEIPDQFGNSCYRNPFCYQDNWDNLKKLITQLNDEEKNIIIFITDCSVGRIFDQCIEDIDIEINRGYEKLRTGKTIPSDLALLTELNNDDKNGINYIKKYVESKKLFIITDERQPSNQNIILPKNSNERSKFLDKNLLEFFGEARLKLFNFNITSQCT